MSAEDRRIAQDLLRSGERLVWCGRPDAEVWLSPWDWLMIVFFFGFTLFAVLLAVVSAMAGSALAVACSAAAVFLGAYMEVGRLLVRHRRKLKSVYVLTDHRAVVAVGGRVWRESPWRDRPRIVRHHGSHITVAFHGPVHWPDPVGRWRKSGQYWDRGWFLFGRPAIPGVQFFDVANGKALLSSLDRPSPTGMVTVGG